jgi:hypothetical protein
VDFWNRVGAANLARDLYAPPVAMRVVSIGNVSGYGPTIQLSPVGQPNVVILMGHVTEISVDVVNAKATGQALPAGSYVGTAARPAGKQTVNSPHVHIEATNGQAPMTREQIIQLLRTGGA